MIYKMVYGYARVSSSDQNLDRQLSQLKEFVEDSRNIVSDKATGKTFDRKGYNSLVGTETTHPILREGDLLIVCSLDRLGRNYTEIQQQWQHITKTLKADIRILDMPLLDTSNSNNSLDQRFIADLVLQILSYTAEKERLNIKKRQKQGIDVAKSQGKHLGRPRVNYPQQWEQIHSEWKKGHITATKAMENLNIKRTTFYKLSKAWENEKK